MGKTHLRRHASRRLARNVSGPQQIGYPTAGRSTPESRPRTPDQDKGLFIYFLQKKDMQDKKKPARGFFLSIFPERVRFCVGEAQTGKACLRRHANLRFARISRSRAPERKKNAIQARAGSPKRRANL